MRFALVAFSLALAASAQAKTVLHVPLFVEVSGGVQPNPTYDYVPMSEFNKTLVAKGQSAQQESVDLGKGVRWDYFAWSEKVDNAIAGAKIENTQAFGEDVPARHSKGAVRTCYTGDGNEVIDIVKDNTDNLYSDQFQLIGWKFGAKTVFSDNEDTTDKDEMKRLNDESKIWRFYRKDSDAVVILAAVGDDGTDVEESYIPKCK